MNLPVRIFVSYSHQDARYLEEESLLGFLRGLELDGVEFWSDKRLIAGDAWDDEIKARIATTDIALVLVSQRFLDSAYCADVEVEGFLRESRDRGLVIFPVILSACEWGRHDWLKSKHFWPHESKTVEEHYRDPGPMKRLFHEIRQDLRAQIDKLRAQRERLPDITTKPIALAPEAKTATDILQKLKLMGSLLPPVTEDDKSRWAQQEIRRKKEGQFEVQSVVAKCSQVLDVLGRWRPITNSDNALEKCRDEFSAAYEEVEKRRLSWAKGKSLLMDADTYWINFVTDRIKDREDFTEGVAALVNSSERETFKARLDQACVEIIARIVKANDATCLSRRMF